MAIQHQVANDQKVVEISDLVGNFSKWRRDYDAFRPTAAVVVCGKPSLMTFIFCCVVRLYNFQLNPAK